MFHYFQNSNLLINHKPIDKVNKKPRLISYQLKNIYNYQERSGRVDPKYQYSSTNFKKLKKNSIDSRKTHIPEHESKTLESQPSSKKKEKIDENPHSTFKNLSSDPKGYTNQQINFQTNKSKRYRILPLIRTT